MTKRAVLTIGIPGSGKSFWAASQDTLVEINLDKCRAMVPGSKGEHDQAVTSEAVALHGAAIQSASNWNADIVISDTNLNPYFRDLLEERLMQLGYTVEYKEFDTPYGVCVARNQARANPVPLDAMERMQASMDAYMGRA